MGRFDEIETFVRVVEAGSFSAAAERLQLAKSGVSRRVTDLEERLGVRLLNRTTRRLSLTESGQQLYERALRLLADLEEAEQLLAVEQGEVRGRFRIAAPLSFGILHLAPLVAEFLDRHPKVVIDLDLNDRLVNLVEEGFDMAIRIGRLGDSTLVAKRLATIRMVACASPAYLERHGTPSQPEELVCHRGLVYSNVPEGQSWRFTDRAGETRTVKVPLQMRANNGDVLLRAAIQGVGVIVIPTFLAYKALQAGEVKAILADFQLESATAYAVYPSHRHLPHRVRLFIELLAHRLGEEPYWDRLPEQRRS